MQIKEWKQTAGSEEITYCFFEVEGMCYNTQRIIEKCPSGKCELCKLINPNRKKPDD